MLAALGFELPGDGFATPRHRLPIDVAKLVVQLILAQALEVAAAAQHARAPQPHLRQLSTADEQLVLADIEQVGIHLDIGGGGEARLTDDQPEHAPPTEVDVPETIIAP